MANRTQGESTLLVYADYVCPFCYLGTRSLAEYERERDDPLSVEWHPFDLRRHKRGPDGTIDYEVDDGKDEAYFDQVRENVERLKQEYGADDMLGIDEVPDVDSVPAQLASRTVQERAPDRWRAFDDAVYTALWEDGADIEDPDVLAGLGADAGVDPDVVRDALTSADRRESLFAAFEDAADRGITGVPTFVFAGTAARGAVPPTQLRRLVEG